MPDHLSPQKVAIIGGGFSGAATAYQLATKAAGALEISIFEPREALGRGVAYSTTDPVHRINVPANRMTFTPEDASHFERWLQQHHGLRNGQGQEQGQGPDGDPAALLPDGRCFPARQLFGDYVADQMQPLLQSGAVRHVRGRVQALTETGSAQRPQWRLRTDDGAEYQADLVVIATSHPPPSPPALLAKAFAGQAKFITDPWAEGVLNAIEVEDAVLIVGTGLTMADVVASLDRLGHQGPITAISRRGQRSRSHAAVAVEPYGDFISPPATSALQLLRQIRRAVKPDQPWQGLFDQLRTQGGAIWQALPLKERRRLIRHLRPFWDTHRFRIAPQVDALLDRKIAEQMLHIGAASVQSAALEDGAYRVDFRSRSGELWHGRYDAVITTTGPAHHRITASQKFLADLDAAGALAEDPTGLGLAVDAQSHLLGPQGSYPTLFVAGPLARGTFGELMGLPEVSAHAAFVAQQILSQLFSNPSSANTGSLVEA